MKKLAIAFFIATPLFGQPTIRTSGLSRALADSLYCQLSGGTAGCTMTGKIRFINGTAAAPSGDSAVGGGFHFISSGISIDSGGAANSVIGQGVATVSGGTYGWTSSATDPTATAVLKLASGGSKALDILGSAAGGLRLDVSNFTATRAWTFNVDAASIFVGTDATQTLTNKTLSLGSNTITATSAQVATAVSDETGSGLLVFATSPNITTPTGIVKGDVGLGNVDNTSDATKNAASVTLTNKTLTSPTINGPSVTALNVTDADLEINGARLTAFAFQVANNAGTIQHLFADEFGARGVSSLVTRITGASNAAVNTPVVASGVDFVGGAGIDTTQNARMIFNTAAQTAGYTSAICTIVQSTATGFIGCDTRLISTNVNGTTRTRLAIQFIDGSGVNKAINTTNITSGQIVMVRVFGFVF